MFFDEGLIDYDRFDWLLAISLLALKLKANC